MYGDFFAGVPTCPDAVVSSVETKAAEHFARVAKALDAPRTVSQVLGSILNHQGTKLVGIKAYALEKAVDGVVSAMESRRLSFVSSNRSRSESSTSLFSGRGVESQKGDSVRFHFAARDASSKRVQECGPSSAGSSSERKSCPSAQQQEVLMCSRSSGWWATLRQNATPQRLCDIAPSQDQLLLTSDRPYSPPKKGKGSVNV